MPAFPHSLESERVSVIPFSENQRFDLTFVIIHVG